MSILSRIFKNPVVSQEIAFRDPQPGDSVLVHGQLADYYAEVIAVHDTGMTEVYYYDDIRLKWHRICVETRIVEVTVPGGATLTAAALTPIS